MYNSVYASYVPAPEMAFIASLKETQEERRLIYRVGLQCI